MKIRRKNKYLCRMLYSQIFFIIIIIHLSFPLQTLEYKKQIDSNYTLISTYSDAFCKMKHNPTSYAELLHTFNNADFFFFLQLSIHSTTLFFFFFFFCNWALQWGKASSVNQTSTAAPLAKCQQSAMETCVAWSARSMMPARRACVAFLATKPIQSYNKTCSCIHIGRRV